jgi:hypothetical protein
MPPLRRLHDLARTASPAAVATLTRIEAEFVDPPTQQVAQPRLRQAEALCRRGLRETPIRDSFLNGDHHFGARLQICGFRAEGSLASRMLVNRGFLVRLAITPQPVSPRGGQPHSSAPE